MRRRRAPVLARFPAMRRGLSELCRPALIFGDRLVRREAHLPALAAEQRKLGRELEQVHIDSGHVVERPYTDGEDWMRILPPRGLLQEVSDQRRSQDTYRPLGNSTTCLCETLRIMNEHRPLIPPHRLLAAHNAREYLALGLQQAEIFDHMLLLAQARQWNLNRRSAPIFKCGDAEPLLRGTICRS